MTITGGGDPLAFSGMRLSRSVMSGADITTKPAPSKMFSMARRVSASGSQMATRQPFRPGARVPSCQLSPADDWTFWVLGDAVMGVLGSTTVLGF